jgi:arsenate reductase (glutaredoxin)
LSEFRYRIKAKLDYYNGQADPPFVARPALRTATARKAGRFDKSRKTRTIPVSDVHARGICMKATIYHNPRCSKSRATLELLREQGVDVDIVEYLESPPDRRKLQQLIRKLGIRPRDLIRDNEAEFRESGVSLDDTDAKLLDLMIRVPKVIQRPIVEIGDRAVIGRPPENVLELLS